ncbi:hypothetical protein TNCV_2826341 [Trichonephila clavipes]|nr:hypothetical protein TNCV_2826341 [Trichonephila clavipes]
MLPYRGPRNPSWQRAICTSLSLAVALSTIQVTVRFESVPPNFEGEHPRVVQGPPTFLPLPPTFREDLWLDAYLKYPHDAKALFSYKHPCFFWDSIPGHTAQQSAFLITISE